MLIYFQLFYFSSFPRPWPLLRDKTLNKICTNLILVQTNKKSVISPWKSDYLFLKIIQYTKMLLKQPSTLNFNRSPIEKCHRGTILQTRYPVQLQNSLSVLKFTPCQMPSHNTAPRVAASRARLRSQLWLLGIRQPFLQHATRIVKISLQNQAINCKDMQTQCSPTWRPTILVNQ